MTDGHCMLCPRHDTRPRPKGKRSMTGERGGGAPLIGLPLQQLHSHHATDRVLSRNFIIVTVCLSIGKERWLSKINLLEERNNSFKLSFCCSSISSMFSYIATNRRLQDKEPFTIYSKWRIRPCYDRHPRQLLSQTVKYDSFLYP